ncbi:MULTISPECIES: tRNA (guanosine(46)-N7)-methyltransferase TrmB [Spongiibacter]|uniref:tRNA (guanosine(46)-N7)-methyltransferase TrmB n=1 Tax=Spongiibacter TaxID=630749 RepID=UPI000C5A887F|nr:MULTISPECIES: tRNA (guanosine(46)-N7)-methyltransferase TrmB [Spongiibacter]MAY39227.1 tRNA (guanosine(46)-N7)-methyltransferase TrmB [Spongiibacter sp.]MBI57554.1 tRNA (guanosine(46)-N7)-methyltransferase TrmB [Spongiibacter sp.]|tara:strand:- start:965 stop:1660 length:696 start_codon:yes stop_codon:yes gene_type:complete
MSETAKKMRRIRSFVLRTGRMTEGQKRAYDLHWPSKGLELKNDAIVLPEVFGRDAPVVLEIGFGMGDSLAQMAAAEPDKDFIGVEVHSPGVGRLMHLIDESGIENLRAYCDDAVEVLEQCIADNSLSRVQIYFPDPWHKKRHHKRRLVQPEFVQLLRRKLKPGGVIHLATDWENYAEHMMLVMSGAEGFRNTQGEGAFAPRPDYRPVTKFEKRGERLGHGVWDLLFEKTAD